MLSKYSDAVMYMPTARPMTDAMTIFFWNMMQVATQRPKYVKYLVVLIWKFLSAVDPSEKIKSENQLLKQSIPYLLKYRDNLTHA